MLHIVFTSHLIYLDIYNKFKDNTRIECAVSVSNNSQIKQKKIRLSEKDRPGEKKPHTNSQLDDSWASGQKLFVLWIHITGCAHITLHRYNDL